MRVPSMIPILLATALPLTADNRSSESVPVQFPSAGATVHGRFFRCTGDDPIGTLLLVPGWPGNPRDVLGLGALLADQEVNVCMFNPRGMHSSEGTFAFSHTLEDIEAALAWLKRSDIRERFRVDPTKLALGGHSFGGAMAMAYAATDPDVRRVVSIAGNDLGWLIRRMQADAQYADAIRQMLISTRAPDGPVRFDLEAALRELAEHQAVYGLQENSSRLAERSILLIGGWDDSQVTVEDVLLPLYRSLKAVGARDVTLIGYHDDHAFQEVREELAADIHRWLARPLSR